MEQPSGSGSRKRTIAQTEPTIIDDPIPLKRTLEMKLEHVEDDIDGTSHDRMDKRVHEMIKPGVRLDTGLRPLLLMAIVDTSEGKLDSRYTSPSLATSLLEEYPGLKDALEEAWEEGTFRRIRTLKILRPPQVTSTPMIHSHELEYFKRAFEMEYTSEFPDILLTTMDHYMVNASDGYYNRSFSIVQSSGTGKSRLVDFSARSRFTFPFNLHERMAPGSYAYPPCDHQVCDYLTQVFSDENRVLKSHIIFLEALFTSALKRLETYKSGSPEDIAQTWYDWLKLDATSRSVGTNRVSFYDEVVNTATALDNSTIVSDSDVVTHQERLVNGAGRFTGRLKELHGDIHGKFAAIVYFDEAHTLQRPSSNGTMIRSPYFTLMSVLNKLINLPIFFIFLSTSSSLLASAPKDPHYPSFRIQLSGEKLIPPFFELTYDTFCHHFTRDLQRDGKLTLNGVCEIGQIAKFGRPIWYSHYRNVEHSGVVDAVIQFAEMKLRLHDFENSREAQLAALDCRVLIHFDPIQSNEMQAELVRTYMRTIFNIPTSKAWMWSGYPSEPVLAEAAARLLNKTHRGIASLAPQILEWAINQGFVARGERGELVARTLFTIAHDLAVLQQYPDVSVRRFHYPVRLLTFLEQLLAPDLWHVVRNATPFHAYPDDPTLETAFQHAWLNFSHFIQLGDHSSFTIRCASELLKRGAAIQAYDNQYGVDGALPILFGDPSKTAVDMSHTSLVQYQVKNAATSIRVSPEPDIAGRIEEQLPILSIVMQLGVEMEDLDSQVVVQTTKKGTDTPSGHTRSSLKSQPTDVERRHYLITVYGCTSNTYRVIAETSTEYCHALQAEKPFADFPRAGLRANEESVRSLKPVVYDKEGMDMPWRDWNRLS